jgi:hypothetical protein
MKDTDPLGEPKKKTRFFSSTSTGPEEYFSFEDQTWLGMFRSRFNYLTEVGLFRKLSVQIRCPDCDIMYRCLARSELEELKPNAILVSDKRENFLLGAVCG